MKTLKIWSHIVTITLWVVAIALAYYQVIPWWLATAIVIAVMFLGGYITLWVLRDVLGENRFSELITQAAHEQASQRQIEEIVRNTKQEVVQELEANFGAWMKERSAGQKLGQLPAWQIEYLTEHRRLRPQKPHAPNEFVWTRASKGSLITELEQCWIQVMHLANGRFGFSTYSKTSGSMGRASFDFDSEQQAVDAVQDFIIHGTPPDSLERELLAEHRRLKSEQQAIPGNVV